jgi:hypothetical protein
VIAFLLSPFTPLGLARRAEIEPGISANGAVLALGGLSVLAVTLLVALVPAWRNALDVSRRGARVSGRAGRSAARGNRFRFGPAAAAARSMALGRRGGIALRVSLLAMLVAVTGVVAALTFGTSLWHLVDTPREQGWTWDVFVGNPNAAQAFTGDPRAPSLHNRMTTLLDRDPSVAAYAGVATADATIDGHLTGVAGFARNAGSIHSFVVDGRAPRSSAEIALGGDVLSRVHKSIGQQVTVVNGHRRATMRIVGETLLPTAGDVSPRLSDGAVTTLAGLRRIQPGTVAFQFAVRYRPGVDRVAARRALVANFGHEVLQPYPGGEVGNLERIDVLPGLLAGLLVVLAAGALVLTLFGSVRRNARAIAVLQTLGFVRRQVMGTIVWQASALAVVAAVVGLPLGIALGRWSWRLVAGSIGSVSPAEVPLGAVLIVVPLAVVVANLLAAGPAWKATGVRPADGLRVE